MTKTHQERIEEVYPPLHNAVDRKGGFNVTCTVGIPIGSTIRVCDEEAPVQVVGGSMSRVVYRKLNGALGVSDWQEVSIPGHEWIVPRPRSVAAIRAYDRLYTLIDTVVELECLGLNEPDGAPPFPGRHELLAELHRRLEVACAEQAAALSASPEKGR